MIKELLTRLFGRWLLDPEVLNAYRTKIPNKLTLNYKESDGKILIRVTSIDNKPIPDKVLLVTEADKKGDVIAMVNDLIMGYKDVPMVYRPWFEEVLELQGDFTKKSDTLTLVKA